MNRNFGRLRRQEILQSQSFAVLGAFAPLREPAVAVSISVHQRSSVAAFAVAVLCGPWRLCAFARTRLPFPLTGCSPAR
jgi:hypothetical protein